MFNFEQFVQFNKPLKHSGLPVLLRRFSAKRGPRAKVYFFDALRLIRLCLKLFISVCVRLLNCCEPIFPQCNFTHAY